MCHKIVDRMIRFFCISSQNANQRRNTFTAIFTIKNAFIAIFCNDDAIHHTADKVINNIQWITSRNQMLFWLKKTSFGPWQRTKRHTDHLSKDSLATADRSALLGTFNQRWQFFAHAGFAVAHG